MFLTLVVDSERYPEEIVLAALDAAQGVLLSRRVKPLIAWRDSAVLQDWNSHWHPPDMVSDEETHGAMAWDDAVAQARKVLGALPSDYLDIQVITFNEIPIIMNHHGPNRYVWRRNWAWFFDEWVRHTLSKVWDASA